MEARVVGAETRAEIAEEKVNVMRLLAAAFLSFLVSLLFYFLFPSSSFSPSRFYSCSVAVCFCQLSKRARRTKSPSPKITTSFLTIYPVKPIFDHIPFKLLAKKIWRERVKTRLILNFSLGPVNEFHNRLKLRSNRSVFSNESNSFVSSQNKNVDWFSWFYSFDGNPSWDWIKMNLNQHSYWKFTFTRRKENEWNLPYAAGFY